MSHYEFFQLFFHKPAGKYAHQEKRKMQLKILKNTHN